MVKCLDRRFSYESWAGKIPNQDSNCRLRIYQHNGIDLVVLTWDQKSQGTSVTNMIEVITDAVCKQFNLHPNNVICFEHVTREKCFFGGPTYKRMHFSHVGGVRSDPKWTDVDLGLLETMIGEPLN